MKDEERLTPGRFLKYAALAVGALIVVGIAWSIVTVVTAPARTAAGIINRTLDADNVLATYERFHDRWKGYQARLSQIRETSGYLTSETNQAEAVRLRVDLTAQRQSCREIASGYNADAAKTNRDIFRGREAPASLDMEACSR